MKKFYIVAFIAILFGISFGASYKYLQGNQTTISAKIEVKDAISKGPTSTREIASSGNFEVNEEQQAKFDELTNDILKMKTKSDVKTVSSKIIKTSLDPKYSQMPAIVILAQIAKSVLPLEGFFWRLRKLGEQSDLMHTFALFRLRSFAQFDYLYGSHVKAIFEFLTEPLEKGSRVFNTMSEFQDTLLEAYTPVLEDIIKNLNKLQELPAEQFEFKFDRAIVTGVSEDIRFIDNDERYRYFIKPYLYTITFLYERFLSSIYFMSSVYLDDLPAAFNDILKKSAINNIENKINIFGEKYSAALGVTPEMVITSFNKYDKLFNARIIKNPVIAEKNTQKYLDLSFKHAKSAANNQLYAFVCGIKYPLSKSDVNPQECMNFDNSFRAESSFIENGDEYIFNPNRMLIDFKSKYHALSDRAKLFNEAKDGQYVNIVSDVTGAEINLNIKALFKVRKDWKAFFPTQFEASGKPGSINKTVNSWAWNYYYGRPTAFPDPTFGGLFNKSEVSTTADIYKQMTTILYTDGLAPFAVFIPISSPVQWFKLPQN